MYDSRVPISAYAFAMVEHSRKMERERNEKTWLAMEFAGELAALRDAVRNLRDVQGRHQAQIATERLFAPLPENA